MCLSFVSENSLWEIIMFWLFFENIECSSQDWRKVPTILTQDLDANSKNYNIVLGDRSLRSEQVGQDTIRRDRASSATCCRSYWDVGNQSTVATSHNMWRKALHGTNCNPWWWSYWKNCPCARWQVDWEEISQQGKLCLQEPHLQVICNFGCVAKSHCSPMQSLQCSLQQMKLQHTLQCVSSNTFQAEPNHNSHCFNSHLWTNAAHNKKSQKCHHTSTQAGNALGLLFLCNFSFLTSLLHLALDHIKCCEPV